MLTVPVPQERFRIVFLLFIFLVVAFYDVVFLGKTFKVTTANSQALPTGAYGQENNKPAFIPVNGTDTPVCEEPIYEFIKRNLRQGILPLWNPHQGCGYPLIGMLEIGIFYPLSLIMYLLPEFYAWDILILARFLLAGLFAFWLMRTLGFSKTPALVSGIAFMLSGPMVLLQFWIANVDILTPLLLVALERLIHKADKKRIALLGLVVSLTVLGGHPEHVFLVNAYGVCFFVFRLYALRKKARVREVMGSYLLAYGLGIGLSAIVLFPFLRNLLTEFWHGHPPDVGVRIEEQRGRFLSLALPHFFQEVPVTYQWSFAGWWGGYLGTLPFGLAFLSLSRPQKRGLNYFFAALAFLIIGKQYSLPVINWIGYLPVFNICRFVPHATHLAALTVAILAGMGTRMILVQRNNFGRGMLFSGALMTVAGIHLIVLRRTATFSIGLKATLFAAGILLIFQVLLFLKDKGRLKSTAIGIGIILLVFGELFCYIHRERPHRFNSFGKVPYIEALKSSSQPIRNYGVFWAFYPNTATGFGVDDLGYFLGLVPERFVEFVNNLIIKDHFRADLRPPALRAIPIQGREDLLDLLNVRHIIAPATDVYAKNFSHFEDLSQRFKTVYANEVRIYERPNAYPRAFIVHRAVFQPDKDKTLQWLRQIGPQLRSVAVINAPVIPGVYQLLKDTPVEDASAAQIVKYTPNEVIINAAMENPGFLVLSDAYHPDWAVTVNGKKWKVFQTDYLIRSVFLPEGLHQVRFVFRPASFYWGAGISVVALMIILGLLAYRRK